MQKVSANPSGVLVSRSEGFRDRSRLRKPLRNTRCRVWGFRV